MLGDTLLEYVYLGTSTQLLEDLKDLKVESSIDQAAIQKDELGVAQKMETTSEDKFDLEPEGMMGLSPDAKRVRDSLYATLTKYTSALKAAETDEDVQTIMDKFFSVMHSQLGAKDWSEKGGGKSAGRDTDGGDPPKPPAPRKIPQDTMESVDFDIIGLLESVNKELIRKDRKIGRLTESIKKGNLKKSSKNEKPKNVIKEEQAKPLISDESRKRLEFNCGHDIYGDINNE